MAFAYYKRLTRRQQGIYRRSNETPAVPLPNWRSLRPITRRLGEVLPDGDRGRVQEICTELLDRMADGLKIRRARILVLARRPSDETEELHGCYTPAPEGGHAVIKVWMRTARRNQVVAFKSFLRTVLHEFCHHLDYVLLGLGDSFHTEGFYRRESSLFHQLVPATRV
ncbi:MAG: hypothetical protein IT489_06090 [Gammaproteobacteria bacterium]|nr:hypothetical protein [Gammaproteobacteria bacterium]